MAESLRMPEIVLNGEAMCQTGKKRRLNQHQMAPIDTPTWSVIFSLLAFLGPLLNLASFEPETANHLLFGGWGGEW